MNKRGELTSSQIIGIVLAVGVLIIIALFYGSFFNEGSLLDKERCHLSVLKRASLPAGEGLTPLDCTTQKTCIISKSGEKCKQFAGEESIIPVKINLDNPEDAATIVERETANAMFDCWNMMGQGKVDVLTRGSFVGQASGWLGLAGLKSFEVSEPQCVVCNRIAVSESILNNSKWENVSNKINVNEYMASHAVPNSDWSYIETFAGIKGIRDYAGIDQRNLSIFDFESEEAKAKFSGTGGSRQLAIIFMQIKSDISPSEAAKDVALGSFVAGAGGIIGVTKVPFGKRVVAGAAKSPWVIVLTAIGIGGTAGFAAYKAHSSEIISAGLCKDFKDGEEEAKVGCSFVKAIDWEKTSINELCYGGIEGYL